VRASITAERNGIPAVSFVIRDFVPLAQHTAQGQGLPEARIAVYDGAIYTHSDEEIDRQIAERVVQQVVDGLTKPVPASAARAEEPPADRPVFKGSFEEVNEFFYRRNWTDGLPIVPPTTEKVAEFLKFTDRDPDEEVAVLPLANLRATPRNIAVNGVMAGCRPEYMPVLLAAVEAIADPKFRLKDIGNTCGCRPYLLINGPIVKQLNFFSGTGLISPGARRIGDTGRTSPNTTIGRALHLIIQNIAGFRPGVSEMAVFGHPQSFVIAEDEEGSPWEPYHVEHGFARDASTVTAMAWMGTIGPESESKGAEAEPHLKSIGMELRCGMHPISYRFGESMMVSVLIPHPIAKVLKESGLSKKQVTEQISRYSEQTVAEINERLVSEEHTIHQFAAEYKYIPESFDVAPEQKIPAVLRPDLLHVVVCGSRERNRTLLLFSFYVNPTTREIKLPADWERKLKSA